jgi:hypothetical protein
MLLRFYPAVHPVLKEISIFHRPARNCSDTSKFEAIGSSDACFHPGAGLIRRFDRRSRFFNVDSSDSTLTRWSHPS